jgi:hypothetical protein
MYSITSFRDVEIRYGRISVVWISLDYWGFKLCLSSGILKNKSFVNCICSFFRWGNGWHLLCWVCYRVLTSVDPVIPHSLIHGAEPFLRSRQLCSYSRNSEHFMESEGSLPCSQEPSTVQVMKLLLMQFPSTSGHFISLRSKYSPQHPFWNTLSLCSSLNVRDQVSHPSSYSSSLFLIVPTECLPPLIWRRK